MANLELITDEQAELVNGGRRHHGPKIVLFPELTSINAPVIFYFNSSDNSFTWNPA